MWSRISLSVGGWGGALHSGRLDGGVVSTGATGGAPVPNVPVSCVLYRRLRCGCGMVVLFLFFHSCFCVREDFVPGTNLAAPAELYTHDPLSVRGSCGMSVNTTNRVATSEVVREAMFCFTANRVMLAMMSSEMKMYTTHEFAIGCFQKGPIYF